MPGEAWSARDWALQQAVDLLNANRCPGCGEPKWLAHDRSTARQWKGTATRCQSCNAREARQNQMSKDVPNPNAIYYGSEFLGYF